MGFSCWCRLSGDRHGLNARRCQVKGDVVPGAQVWHGAQTCFLECRHEAGDRK